ncbi:MAG: hypothetical protein OXH19_05240 [Chloroflexi bacterium]|nr:hypothetical protein [Chloroflexota bacterium]MCY3587896.1 hypothetical protein [Chloroflexota bacterium]MCY3684813.1 hypothetical protein [Chloroflexota bacterium]MDE2708643.1 hypothetical protein [Chloroflexota bacterium]
MATARAVKRTIHFYAIDVGRDDGGKPLHFNHSLLLEAVERLEFRHDSGPSRYEWEPDNQRLCAFFEPPGSRDSLKFCRLRTDDLPEIEEHGTLLPLELRDQAGLAEATHVVFFNDNVAGVLHNTKGPPLSRLGWYLTAKSDNFLRPIQFRPLLRTEPAGRLAVLQDLQKLTLEIFPSYKAAVRAADRSLGDLFDAIEEVVGNGSTIRAEVAFPDGSGQGGLSRFLRPLLMLAQDPNVEENVTAFRVEGLHGDTGQIGPIDLLGDRIVSRRKSVNLKERGRTVDSQSAFGAIRDAYSELRADIETASSVSLR